MRLKFDL